MKFVLDEEVKNKYDNRTGKIIEMKTSFIFENGTSIEINEYKVASRYGVWKWYRENELISTEKFSKEFEIGLLDLLINVNLLHNKNKLHIVEELYDRKFKYI